MFDRRLAVDLRLLHLSAYHHRETSTNACLTESSAVVTSLRLTVKGTRLSLVLECVLIDSLEEDFAVSQNKEGSGSLSLSTIPVYTLCIRHIGTAEQTSTLLDSRPRCEQHKS